MSERPKYVVETDAKGWRRMMVVLDGGEWALGVRRNEGSGCLSQRRGVQASCYDF